MDKNTSSALFNSTKKTSQLMALKSKGSEEDLNLTILSILAGEF
jgi:hypothetical protein